MDQFSLWEGFKSGNQKCLSEIFLSNYDNLFTYAFHLLRDDDLAKDIIQDLFYKLWKNRTNLGDCASIKFYLIKALRSQILDYQRQKKRTSLNSADVALEFDYPYEDWLIATQEEEVTRSKIEKGLKSLSDRQREAIYLRFFEHTDYPKISEIMSVNIQSVRNLIHSALAILKEAFVVVLIVYLLG